jgi:hypothetical protein
LRFEDGTVSVPNNGIGGKTTGKGLMLILELLEELEDDFELLDELLELELELELLEPELELLELDEDELLGDELE